MIRRYDCKEDTPNINQWSNELIDNYHRNQAHQFHQHSHYVHYIAFPVTSISFRHTENLVCYIGCWLRERRRNIVYHIICEPESYWHDNVMKLIITSRTQEHKDKYREVYI
jgi:hypothetical protein